MIIATAALFALGGTAFADGGMSNAFGNIVRVTAGEESFDATFSADGAYTDSRGLTGSWAFTDQLCLTMQAEEGTQQVCGPWNSDLAVGGSWTTAGWSDDGGMITVEIVAAEE